MGRWRLVFEGLVDVMFGWGVDDGRRMRRCIDGIDDEVAGLDC